MLNFWPKRKTPNPLERPIDAAITVLTAQLVKWNPEQRREILAGVMKRTLPEKTHIHKDPKRNKQQTIAA